MAFTKEILIFLAFMYVERIANHTLIIRSVAQVGQLGVFGMNVFILGLKLIIKVL